MHKQRVNLKDGCAHLQTHEMMLTQHAHTNTYTHNQNHTHKSIAVHTISHRHKLPRRGRLPYSRVYSNLHFLLSTLYLARSILSLSLCLSLFSIAAPSEQHGITSRRIALRWAPLSLPPSLTSSLLSEMSLFCVQQRGTLLFSFKC